MSRNPKRHTHLPLPAKVKLEEIHDNRIWVRHPTKGLRSRRVVSNYITRANNNAANTMFNWFNSLNYRSYAIEKYRTK